MTHYDITKTGSKTNEDPRAATMTRHGVIREESVNMIQRIFILNSWADECRLVHRGFVCWIPIKLMCLRRNRFKRIERMLSSVHPHVTLNTMGHKSTYTTILKESNTFIQQGCIQLIKSDGQDLYNVTKRFLFQINAVLLNILFIKELKYQDFQQNAQQHDHFHNYNKKCFLSSKSAY